MSHTVNDNLGSDLLKGATAIADFLGEKPRRVFYLCERGLIPAFKIGQRWHARKSTLRAHFERLEAGAET